MREEYDFSKGIKNPFADDCMVALRDDSGTLIGYYEKLGFKQLGTIPGGFRMKDGHFENICPYYIELV